MHKVILELKPQKEYELLDSGMVEKLERFGSIVLVRPDPQALWPKLAKGDSIASLTLKEKWNTADARFERKGKDGIWQTRKDLPKQWPIKFGGLEMYIRPTSFKHTGLFPEQLSNWDWVRDKLQGKHQRVLNLFAYTGGATLVAAQAGAEVTHVDASKTAVAWARENAELSGLADKPIRWIVEDVLLFVKREIKRDSKYDAIIMDPPAFGRGPKDELWKIEEDFITLIELCSQLLSDTPLFVLISGYAAGYSPLAFAYNLEQFKDRYGGTIECGDLAIQESGGEGSQVALKEPRFLPCGIFGRWSK